MSTPRARVLLVEDDDALREALVAALVDEGYDVRGEPDGLRVPRLQSTFRPDLAVLDVRLANGPSGLGLARMLRSDLDLPILFLSAADTVDDRLAGFEVGADDYLVKPFSMAELLVRVRALLRRSGALTSDSWSVDGLEVDEGGRDVRYHGTPVELTRTEFDILVALGRRPGRVVGKSQLLSEVWGFAEFDPNLVEVHVSSLRRKLEAAGPRLVQTVRGVGYVLRT